MNINLNTYDWSEAFVYTKNISGADPTKEYDLTPFEVTDVSEVLYADEGENDSASWIIAGILNDGRYFYLEAWCDYTGWDCQAGGKCSIASNLEELMQFGLTEGARSRFGLI